MNLSLSFSALAVVLVVHHRPSGGQRMFVGDWEFATSRSLSVRASASQGCTFPDTSSSGGPTRVSDWVDGLSSDGRGPYVQGADGIGNSSVSNAAVLQIFYRNDGSTKKPRSYTVNLDNPVSGGGGVPLGHITDVSGKGIGLQTQWSMVGDAVRNFREIEIGQTVTAAQMNVSFHINERKHILQMGPQPNGKCHNGGVTLVSGIGTSSGTIHRVSKTKWVVDLPAGSMGRLFDISDGTDKAINKGLYYFRLHYEIGS